MCVTTRFFRLLLCASLAAVSLNCAGARAAEKPRVIVLTDISNEPDDEESLVRFLVYSILQVKDDGDPPLFAYRRAILEVTP